MQQMSCRYRLRWPSARSKALVAGKSNIMPMFSPVVCRADAGVPAIVVCNMLGLRVNDVPPGNTR
jgi:hypothetical protein